MKTNITLAMLDELTSTFGKNSIHYIVIAGWGLDGLRGKQTRPHQDIDILCKKEDEKKVLLLMKNLSYVLKNRYSDLYKYFREDGAKIDLACATLEDDMRYTNGRIAITRFPASLFDNPQEAHINQTKYFVAPNEMLKTWGIYSQNTEDKSFSENLMVNEELMKKIKRVLK